MDLSVRDLPRPSMSVLVRQLTSEMWTRDTLLPVHCITMGAIHSTKISGPRFENFLVSNGSRPVRTVSFHYTQKTSFTLI